MATKMFKWPKKFTFGVFRCFQLILKMLKIFTENWMIFGKKKSFLSCLYKQIFNGKSIKSAWNALISLKMYLRVFSKILENYILGYFVFFYNFTAVEMHQEGALWVRITIFCQKALFFRISAAVKLEKNKKSPQNLVEVVVNRLRCIFTHF